MNTSFTEEGLKMGAYLHDLAVTQKQHIELIEKIQEDLIKLIDNTNRLFALLNQLVPNMVNYLASYIADNARSENGDMDVLFRRY